jgi:Holliday junction resolvasome RuvABC ATP-dependent DNA helicase subunit
MTKKAHQPVSLNIDEAKSILSHIVTNNRYLQENNKLPVAVEVIGDSGIGKTSMVLQVAKELNLNLVKLNLAQIEELGDLVGFPIRQFEVC